MAKSLLVAGALLFAVSAEAYGSEGTNGGQSLQALESRCYSTPPDPKSCLALGSALTLGIGNAASPESAAKAFQVACDAKLQTGCARLGDLAIRGKGTSKNSTKGLKLLRGACDAGDETGCWLLGKILAEGVGGIRRDQPAASKLLSKACGLGLSEACDDFGILLSKDDKADFGSAALLFQRGCASAHPSPGACGNLGLLYSSGQGVQRDSSKARQYLELGCSLHHTRSCVNLAYELITTGSPSDAKRGTTLLQESCEGGNSTACSNLAIIYQEGKYAPKDEKRAAALNKKACDKNEFKACRNLGLIYGIGSPSVPKDEHQAIALFTKACDGGDISSCTQVGICYLNGLGVSRDEVKARTTFTAACAKDDPEACESLAFLYAKGDPAHRDLKRANGLLEKACKLGRTVACKSPAERGE